MTDGVLKKDPGFMQSLVDHVLSTVIIGFRAASPYQHYINERPSWSTESRNLLSHSADAALCVVVM